MLFSSFSNTYLNSESETRVYLYVQQEQEKYIHLIQYLDHKIYKKCENSKVS